MSDHIYYIGKIRARNSSLGRAKEIHFKTDENHQWYLDRMIRFIRKDVIEYFDKYDLPYFKPDLLVYPKVVHSKYYMERHIPYIQGTYYTTEVKQPPNFFKSYDEVEDYLMKYYFTSSVEYNFFNYITMYKDQADRDIPYYVKRISELEMPMSILKKAGIVDLKAEYERYKETGKSDLPIILYANWKKYKENRNWLKEEISKSEESSSLNSLHAVMKFVNNNVSSSIMSMITNFY